MSDTPGDTIHVHVEYFDGTDEEDSGQPYFVATCEEISVVTGGATFEELMANIREAVQLHLEGEDTVTEFNLAPNPRLIERGSDER